MYRSRSVVSWMLLALLPWLALPAAAAAQSRTANGVSAVETDSLSSGTRYRTYSFFEGSTLVHEFTVGFDEATGYVRSVSGDAGKDFVIGDAAAKAAVNAALNDRAEAGVKHLLFNAEAPRGSLCAQVEVVNQTASPTSTDLPASDSYDAVSSFAMPDGGRALLFWSGGELTEARVLSTQLQGDLKVPITIDIDCTITYTPGQGWQIKCTIKIKIGPLTVFEQTFTYP